MTSDDIRQGKWDDTHRYYGHEMADEVSSTKSTVSDRDRKAMADYYEAGLRVGRRSEDLLQELSGFFRKSSRQIYRHIRHERELRENGRQWRLTQHSSVLAYTASILARNAGSLHSWQDSYGENWGDIVIGVMPRTPGPIGFPGIVYEDPYAIFRQPPTTADEYAADCLLAHFNEEFPRMKLEHWKAVTVKTVNRELVDVLQLLSMRKSFKPTSGCHECAGLAEEPQPYA